jgi:SAM-dependent methyltransferase
MVISDSYRNLMGQFSVIADRYKQHNDYRRMYKEYAEVSQAIWDDTNRSDYDSDVWYNLNCNEICLELLGNLCDGKRVLSVGGGFWIEKALLDKIKAEEIVRTDIVPEEGVLEEDAANLSFRDSTFDVVICRELIEHVPDSDKVYGEIKRVLKTGGYLLITTPNVYAVHIDGTFHVRGYTPSSFLAELKHQGFKVIDKKGNIPYGFHGLKIYSQAGIDLVLDEFKKIDKMTRNYKNLYYLSTQLFVLCQKDGK